MELVTKLGEWTAVAWRLWQWWSGGGEGIGSEEGIDGGVNADEGFMVLRVSKYPRLGCYQGNCSFLYGLLCVSYLRPTIDMDSLIATINNCTTSY